MKHSLDGLIFYDFGRWLCRSLPRWYCTIFARGMADLTMLTDRDLLAVKAEHYRFLFPSLSARERARMARECFRNFARMIVDNFYATDLHPETIDRYVVAREGEEHLVAAVRSGKGVLVLGGHLGSWEMAGSYMSRHGFPVSVVAKEEDTSGLRRYREWYRARSGTATVTVGKDPLSLLSAARVLQGGGCVAMLVDVNLGGPSVVVDFAGSRARLPSGWVTLARTTGCRVVTAFLLPLRTGGYKVVMEPPFSVPDCGAGERDTQTLLSVRRFAESLEPRVRAHP